MLADHRTIEESCNLDEQERRAVSLCLKGAEAPQKPWGRSVCFSWPLTQVPVPLRTRDVKREIEIQK